MGIVCGDRICGYDGETFPQLEFLMVYDILIP